MNQANTIHEIEKKMYYSIFPWERSVDMHGPYFPNSNGYMLLL